MRTLALALVLLTASAGGSRAAAQDVLERAKSEYAAAAYDEALATLSGLEAAASPADAVQVQQYRAFCLIALGKTEEAERAIGALVETDPHYVPSATVASPRVLSLVSDMRRKSLPGVARRLLEDGRAAYTRKDFPEARRHLALLLEVLEDDALSDRPGNEDLRVIASGFMALTDAASSTPAQRSGSSTDARLPGSAPAAGTEGTASPADPAELSSSPSVSPTVAGTLQPPVAVEQTVPVWVPPDGVAGAHAYNGAVKVRIGTDGRVKVATIERPSHPVYDVRLLQAAKGWVYRPAMRNGQPVESEKIVAVQLSPRK